MNTNILRCSSCDLRGLTQLIGHFKTEDVDYKAFQYIQTNYFLCLFIDFVIYYKYFDHYRATALIGSLNTLLNFNIKLTLFYKLCIQYFIGFS